MERFFPGLLSFFRSRELSPFTFNMLDRMGVLPLRGWAALKREVPCMTQEKVPDRNDTNPLEMPISLLRRFRDASEEAGAQFLVVEKPKEASFGKGELDSELGYIQRELGASGIEYLKLTPVFKSKGLSGDDVFISGSHLSSRGARIAGDAISDWLRARELAQAWAGTRFLEQ